MTTQQNAATTAVQAEPCPKAGNLSRLAMEGAANEALSISLAVKWITQAQTLLDEIQSAARNNPEINQIFRDQCICINEPNWNESEMSQHVSRILARQQVLIKRMAGGAA